MKSLHNMRIHCRFPPQIIEKYCFINLRPCPGLHVSSVLAPDLVQRLTDLPQRAGLDRLHQGLENVAARGGGFPSGCQSINYGGGTTTVHTSSTIGLQIRESACTVSARDNLVGGNILTATAANAPLANGINLANRCNP